MASLSRLATRRKFLSVTALLSVSALAAACGAATPTPDQSSTAATPAPKGTAPASTSAPTQAPAKPTAAPKSAEQVKLTFWTPHSGKDCERWELTATTYMQVNATVNVEKVECGTGEQNFNEVLLSRIAAGTPPDLTIIWDTPVSFGVRGSLITLDDLMKTSKYSAESNWPETVLASCKWDGKTYGFPTMVGVYGIYYNQDWFEKQGIKAEPTDFPQTWDELRTMSKQFTKWDGDRLETAGFIPNWTEAETWPIWLALDGSTMFDADNHQYTIDAEGNVATMDYALSWMDEEYKGDIVKVTSSGSWSMGVGPQGQPPAFQTQRLASLIGGSWDMGTMYQEVPPTFERWNLAIFPHGPNGSASSAGYWPNWFAIPKGTKTQDAAFAYLDWINGDGIRHWFATNPDIPTNKHFPRDLLPELTVQKRGKDFAAASMQYWYDQLDRSTPMWQSPVQGFATDQIARALERIYRKAAAPKDALAEAQKASQAELDKILKG